MTPTTVSNPTLRRLILLGTPLALTILMLFHPWPYDDPIGKLMPIANWWFVLHTVLLFLLVPLSVALYLLVEGLYGIAATVSRVGALVFAVFYGAGDSIAGISNGILARSARDLPPEEQAAVARDIQTIFADLTKTLIFLIGDLGWMVALVAAAMALYGVSTLRLPLLLLVLSVVSLVIAFIVVGTISLDPTMRIVIGVINELVWLVALVAAVVVLYRAGMPLLPLILLTLSAGFLTPDHAVPFGSLGFGFFFLFVAWLEFKSEKLPPSQHPQQQIG